MPYRMPPEHTFRAIPFPLHTGNYRAPIEVSRETFERMPTEQRMHCWYITVGQDGRGTRRVFPFFDDTGVFAWRPGEPR